MRYQLNLSVAPHKKENYGAVPQAAEEVGDKVEVGNESGDVEGDVGLINGTFGSSRFVDLLKVVLRVSG